MFELNERVGNRCRIQVLKLKAGTVEAKTWNHEKVDDVDEEEVRTRKAELSIVETEITRLEEHVS